MNQTALRRVPGLLVLGLGIAVVLIAAAGLYPLLFGPTHEFVVEDAKEVDQQIFHSETPTPEVETRDTAGGTGSVDQSDTVTPVPEIRGSDGVYEFSDLTDREQRILQRAMDTESGIATAHTSGEHFRVMEDAGHLGHGFYYIHVEDTYYLLKVRHTSNTGFGAGLRMLVLLVVLGIGGCVTLSALISLRQTPPSVAGPSALLSGSVIVAASFLTAPSAKSINRDLFPWSIAVTILVYGGFVLYSRWHD